MRTILCCLVVLALVPMATAGWEEDVDLLRAAKPDPAVVDRIVAAGPDALAVLARLRAPTFPAAGKGKAFLRETVCRDGVTRPWVLVVPDGYDPARPTPLLVVLHGGVSRAEVVDTPLEYVEGNHFAALARERGWLAIYPFGQAGAVWWDEVGMGNIHDLVRLVKRERNVDDDRVAMVGFSDGGSAGFLHAMVAPNDYGAILALNGHMGVGSWGEIDTYAPNFANVAVYACTSDADQLYPSARMRKTIEMARRAGGRIFYREMSGQHDFTHLVPEMPALAGFLERHRRDPFPTRIVWETASKQLGRCRWLAIEQLRDEPAAPWHADHNATMTDDRVSIGFGLAPHEGDGVKVGPLSEGSYAEKHLLEGDVIVEMNGEPVKTIEDLSNAKSKVSRGDRVVLKVLRKGKETVIDGNLPEVSRYFLFQRKRPSGLVRAEVAANRFTLETSRVGRLRILVHPEMVNLEWPVTVIVNGKRVFHGRVKPDVRFLVESYLADRDRTALPVAALEIEIP